MTRATTIIFDVDGTLIDSAADIHGALNYGLALAGCGSIEFGASRELIGLGLEGSLDKILADRGRRFEAGELARIRTACTAYYDAHLVVHTRLFADVRETLEVFRRAGVAMGLCTNKRAEPTRHILAALGVSDYFGVLMARGSLPQGKPHPAPLLAAVDALGGRPEEAAMVGDSHIDIDCARAAGVASVAVSYGYSDRPVAELGADHVIERFCELPAVLGAARNI
ncbi:MAG TPA: HAD-IA family hydrolase [Burkholderiales bacterium]|nr:HAD-IA family hydrolase [Burkholderiales bacterium]